VVDFCGEVQNGRFEGVVTWKGKEKFEMATLEEESVGDNLRRYGKGKLTA
jgi:hypothetical protein